MISSFGSPIDVAVFGAGGGIGRAFVDHLADASAVNAVHAFSRKALSGTSSKVHSHAIDILDDTALKSAAEALKDTAPRLVIVATGILHDDNVSPEKTWRHIDAAQMEAVFRINTVAPALIMKHFLGILPREGKSVFAALSARVGSIADNGIGGWYSYRASKAALNMLLRTGSIELARRWPEAACIGLHPGTVNTPLSEPFQGNVPNKKLFTSVHSTQQMLTVIDRVTGEDTGKIFDYAGVQVPY